MPRIEAHNDNGFIDLCARCAMRKGLYGPDGPEHPPYEDDEYHCDNCGEELTEVDD